MELENKEQPVNTCKQGRTFFGYILYLQQICRLGASTRFRSISASNSTNILSPCCTEAWML